MPTRQGGSFWKNARTYTTSATGTSSIRVQGLLERLTLRLHLGAAASGYRQARDDFRLPFNHLGIRARFPLGDQLLYQLNRPLKLLVRHFLDRIAMLDLAFARDKHGEHGPAQIALMASIPAVKRKAEEDWGKQKWR